MDELFFVKKKVMSLSVKGSNEKPRRLRLKNGYTQKETAKLMGFKNLYSYQRLESSKANPEFSTIIQIKQVFPEFSVDEVLAA